MTPETLVRMANQIARAFRAKDGAAVAETCQHIRSFWDPRMRQQLLAHLEAGGEGLDPVARQAAEELDGTIRSTISTAAPVRRAATVKLKDEPGST